ncbi:hypothetical protein [Psychrobacter sp. TAE2020]|uniref:hypothetical protein n=1 Tax=Psychrobacter sp. TAE2020 TaxID=2846762 RepID=UPI001E43B02E|nr:hypothetical protein [Psychrobacter sp. TAE2020]
MPLINVGSQTRMDWLKSILNSLPLEKISDILGEIVIWWSQMVKGVPPADLPMYAYLGGAIVVLILWVLVARMLPRPFGGMSWMILFAVLLAPGTALNDPSVIAPASISVVYAIMMKDTAGAINNALPILVVLVVGLFVGFIWQLIRGAFESSLDKARQRTAADTQATMQLAGGNYLPQDSSVVVEPVEAKQPLPFAILKNNANTSKTVASSKLASSANPTTSSETPIDSDVNKLKDSKLAESQLADSQLTARKVDRDTAISRKPVEGFYSKKTVQDPIVSVDKNGEDSK